MILITRKVDELGRVVLPQDMRDRAGIQLGNTLDLVQDDDGTIHITPAKARCRICGEKEDLHRLDKGVVCARCINAIKKINL